RQPTLGMAPGAAGLHLPRRPCPRGLRHRLPRRTAQPSATLYLCPGEGTGPGVPEEPAGTHLLAAAVPLGEGPGAVAQSAAAGGARARIPDTQPEGPAEPSEADARLFQSRPGP